VREVGPLFCSFWASCRPVSLEEGVVSGSPVYINGESEEKIFRLSSIPFCFGDWFIMSLF